MDHDFQPTSVEPDAAPASGTARSAGVLRWLGRLHGLGRSNRDRQSGLLDRAGLLDRGERLLGSARWQRHDAALAVFDFRDLLEVRGIHGPRASEALLARLVQALQRLAGRHGLAARTGPAQFAVLLPGIGREEAVAAAHRVLGKPCRIELDIQGDELVLVPAVVIDPCEAGELATTYARLAVTLARHRSQQERRWSRMRRDRERHSRPAPLAAP